MGAHGQIQGMGVHWEIWMMQQGGMTNHEALQTATINPAMTLGFDDYIGSLEAGKLADFIVLDKNPLDDIKNTESVKFTVANGRVFDSETMNEIGNYNKPRGKFYWENARNSDVFPMYHDVGVHNQAMCVCGQH
jgi:adenine deaminase